jgi:hypothetical protein
MKTTQGNSLCSYLYLILAKTSCLSFYLLFLFFYRIREQEGGQGSGVGDMTMWLALVGGEGGGETVVEG